MMPTPTLFGKLLNEIITFREQLIKQHENDKKPFAPYLVIYLSQITFDLCYHEARMYNDLNASEFKNKRMLFGYPVYVLGNIYYGSNEYHKDFLIYENVHHD